MMQHGTIGRFVFATLLVAFGTTPPAAAVDSSSDSVSFAPVPCKFHSELTGTTLEVTGVCSSGSTSYPVSLHGMADLDTGAFSLTGEITGLCADLVISGTDDGEESHGTYTGTCGSGLVSSTRCGNG